LRGIHDGGCFGRCGLGRGLNGTTVLGGAVVAAGIPAAGRSFGLGCMDVS
jgi:hypothetical protein